MRDTLVRNFIRGAARTAVVAATAILVGRAAPARAQQLEPRIYLASPVGTNGFGVGVARSTGDVIVDPSLPIKDAHARVGVFLGAYYRSFAIFGRSASVNGVIPLMRASAEGILANEPARVDRLGLGDPNVRLTVNLAGAPGMDTPTFARRHPGPELGASLMVSVPVGQYDGTKIVNLGANRWAYKPELGLTLPIGPRWRVDVYGGVWLFAANTNYLGARREQDPLVTTQVHLSFNLSRRAWVSLDETFYSGGRTRTNGEPAAERLHNTRLGATLSLPIVSRQSIRVAFSKGAFVRLGSNFTTIAVSWNYAWGRGF